MTVATELGIDAKRLFGPSSIDEGVIKMAGKLALRGGWLSPTLIHLPSVPYCSAPVTVGRRVRASRSQRSLEVSMVAPCRKCPKCLQFRRLLWRERMEIETLRAPRTWFVTLTFDPIMMAGIMCEANLLSEAVNIERRIDDAAYKHVQRFLKRLRAKGLKFRYCFVFERGTETNRPHYHALLHEVGSKPVTYRDICTNWPAITHAKLVREVEASKKSTRYLSKYLGKGLTIRPRASHSYGTKQIMTPSALQIPTGDLAVSHNSGDRGFHLRNKETAKWS